MEGSWQSLTYLTVEVASSAPSSSVYHTNIDMLMILQRNRLHSLYQN